MDRYDFIYADPPWRYKNWSMDEWAKYGEKWARRNGRSPYPVMNTADIAALPVSELAHKNSLLAMWVTDPKLEDGLEVMRAWGYKYTTVLFYWVKTNPKGLKAAFGDLLDAISPYLGKAKGDQMVRLMPKIIQGWHFGLGYHSRANPEMCLLGVSGDGLNTHSQQDRDIVFDDFADDYGSIVMSPDVCILGKRGKGLPRKDKYVPRLIVAPLGRHSAKPDIARRYIEILYGETIVEKDGAIRPIRRLELFARNDAPGWTVWGNESSTRIPILDKHVIEAYDKEIKNEKIIQY